MASLILIPNPEGMFEPEKEYDPLPPVADAAVLVYPRRRSAMTWL